MRKWTKKIGCFAMAAAMFLSVDLGGLINNAGFFHLIVEVVTLTGTLSNTGKYGVSTVLSRDVVNQLLDQYGFTYTGSTEQTDLTTLLVRAEKINDLDTGL